MTDYEVLGAGCWGLGRTSAPRTQPPASPIYQHAAGLPAQTPTVHWSPQVVGLPSSQAVPLSWKPSAGQLVFIPLQVSATSQAPVAGRHTVPAGCKLLAGQ